MRMLEEKYMAVVRELEEAQKAMGELREELKIRNVIIKELQVENAYRVTIRLEAVELLHAATQENIGLQLDTDIKQFLQDPGPVDLAAFDLNMMESLKDNLGALRSLLYRDGLFKGIKGGASQVTNDVLKNLLNSYYKITKNGE